MHSKCYDMLQKYVRLLLLQGCCRFCQKNPENKELELFNLCSLHVPTQWKWTMPDGH